MTETTAALVQRWILAFCEAPIMVEPDLMRRVLDTLDQENRTDDGQDVQGG